MNKQILFVALGLVILLGLGMVSAVQQAGCKNLYWFDNENKECGQKEFCGMYMYYGLQTFASKTQCLNVLDGGEEKVCTQEAKQCDDGSYVSRNGSNDCKFDKCAIGEDDEEGNFTLSNGRKAEIKIMPATASAKAIERLGELGFNVSLKEVGKGEDAKVVYELKGNKEGKFLGIFKTMAKVQAQVNAETGETKVIKPWWSFMASGI